MVVHCNADRMNEVYDQYKEYFVSLFHTAMWRIYVDNITAGKLCCFVHNFKNGNIQLGIAYANEAGYMPLPAYFKDGIKHDEAQILADLLSEAVFNLNAEACNQILISSMSARFEGEKEMEEQVN
jgi:hypothetical protein